MVLQKLYSLRLPRYTSYPTAPHFSEKVGEAVYQSWLPRLEAPLSLYFHIPFCWRLCAFCGCHTKICSLYAPIKTYVQALIKELELVAKQIGCPIDVEHIHFGGGSPQILRPEEVSALSGAIRRHFRVKASAEVAIEVDPSYMSLETMETFFDLGLTRVSLGVQDFDAAVQSAIGRQQSLSATAEAVYYFRERGVRGINFDLMYGLPFQSLDSFSQTIEQAASLSPDRIALFGYAHVPWIKKHQRLLEKYPLPDSFLRQKLFDRAAALLKNKGFYSVGIDHFAKEADPLFAAFKNRSLRRNFQGYTTDARPLLGFGASAIGKLAAGYVQNVADIEAYQKGVLAGRLATARGSLLCDQDRKRGRIIEQLMCAFEAECDERHFSEERLKLKSLIEQGFVSWGRGHLRILSQRRLLARFVAAAFDQYLSAGGCRHSLSV